MTKRALICMGLISMAGFALAWAGVASARPGPSHPLQVDPVDPYEASALFTSDGVLAEAQADLDAGIDFAILLNALEVDHLGGVYAIFHAEDRDDTVYVPNTDLQASQHSGIAYWDGADVRILASTSWVYEGVDGNAYDEDLYVGGWMPELERVPALGSGESGPLEEGDVVALRWWNDDPDTSASDDDIAEVVHFRPTYDGSGAVTALDEIGVLYTFPQAGGYGGELAADASGGLYVSLPAAERDSQGGLDLRLWHLAWNAAASAFEAADIAPSFEHQFYIEADDDGALYVLGKSWGPDDGTIFRRVPGGSYETYAYYPQTCCIEAFRAFACDAGVFTIALRQDKRGNWFVAPVEANAEASWSDRVAETAPNSVEALSADADGNIYVLHTDRLFVDDVYEIDRSTVVRLTAGSGDGGSGGPPPGKGKKK